MRGFFPFFRVFQGVLGCFRVFQTRKIGKNDGLAGSGRVWQGFWGFLTVSHRVAQGMAGCQAVPDRTQPVPRQAEGQPMGGYDRTQPVPRQAEGQPMGGYDRTQPVRSPPNPWNSTGTRSKCLIPKGFRQMDRIRVPVLFRTRNTRKRRQRLGLRVLFLTTIYIIYIYL
jgi:hypothetical protein